LQRRVSEYAHHCRGHRGLDGEHGALHHGRGGGALDVEVFEQSQITEPAAMGERHAEPIGTDALARVDQQPVHVGAVEPGVRQCRRDGLVGELFGIAA
jgi:hypothetical protein